MDSHNADGGPHFMFPQDIIMEMIGKMHLLDLFQFALTCRLGKWLCLTPATFAECSSHDSV